MKFERIFPIISALALGFTAFILGGVSVYFEHFPYQWIDDSLSAKEALEEQNVLNEDFVKLRDAMEFKEMHVTINEPGAFDGYTVVTHFFYAGAQLIDMEGHIVYEWQAKTNDARRWRDFQVFPNGDLLVVEENSTSTPYGVLLRKIDKDSNTLWESMNGANHLVRVLPDGRILGTVHRFVDGSEFSNLPYQPQKVLEDSVFILDENGKMLKSIPVVKAMQTSGYGDLVVPKMTKKGKVHEPEEWDVTHTNSAVMLTADMAPAYPMFKEGQILVSLKHLNLIGVLDVESESFVWMKKGAWIGQHDADFNSDGRILLFDNLGAGSDKSRVVAVSPADDTMKVLFKSTKDHPFSSPIMGSVQMLPNNNLLITESTNFRVFEYSQDSKTIVWECALEDYPKSILKNGLYAAKRYRKDYFTFLPQT